MCIQSPFVLSMYQSHLSLLVRNSICAKAIVKFVRFRRMKNKESHADFAQ